MDFVRVYGEMHEGATLEPEDRGVRITVFLVLSNAVPPRLVRVRVLTDLCGDF
jgi:hypothetical protein